MISAETATDIAVIYREIDVAEKLLDEVKKALDSFEQVDIRDTFGRRAGSLQLGVPSSETSRRLFHVPYQLAVPVIEATIANHKARLMALGEKARAELIRNVPATEF